MSVVGPPATACGAFEVDAFCWKRHVSMGWGVAGCVNGQSLFDFQKYAPLELPNYQHSMHWECKKYDFEPRSDMRGGPSYPLNVLQCSEYRPHQSVDKVWKVSLLTKIEIGHVFIDIIQAKLVGGWATPLKNMNVNWDDDINPILSNINGTIKNGNQTTKQKIMIQQWWFSQEIWGNQADGSALIKMGDRHEIETCSRPTRWCPSLLAKLVRIKLFTGLDSG